MRKIYLHGPLTVNDMIELSMEMVSEKCTMVHVIIETLGGAIIRNAIHGLEKLGLSLEQVEKKG